MLCTALAAHVARPASGLWPTARSLWPTASGLLVLLLAAPALAQPADPPQRVAYRHGAALVADGRPDEAYPYFAQAAQTAEARGDTAVSVRARRVLAQMDYNHAARLAWMQRVDDALPYFEAGLANDPDNARNALGYAHALVRLGREEEALRAFRLALTIADRAAQRSDEAVALAAHVRGAVRTHFHAPLRPYLDRPSVALPAPLAASMLGRLALADSHAVADDETLYLRARVLLAQDRAADALALADAFVAQHRGTQAAAAPFQYVRGEALRALGRAREAQAAFRAARFGRVAAWADDRLRTF